MFTTIIMNDYIGKAIEIKQNTYTLWGQRKTEPIPASLIIASPVSANSHWHTAGTQYFLNDRMNGSGIITY